MENTASLAVISVAIQWAPSGMFFFNHTKSLVAEAADVTIRKTVSVSRVTVRSASIPPLLFSH